MLNFNTERTHNQLNEWSGEADRKQNMELVYLVKDLTLKSALPTALLGLSIYLFPSGGLEYFLKKITLILNYK